MTIEKGGQGKSKTTYAITAIIIKDSCGQISCHTLKPKEIDVSTDNKMLIKSSEHLFAKRVVTQPH